MNFDYLANISLMQYFQSATTVITIITSFLPPYHSHLYLPILFRIWESINSAYIDERMLEISAALVRERMNKFCPAMDTAEEPWGDVGIFSDSQWARISRSCLVYMSESLVWRTWQLLGSKPHLLG